MVLFFLSEIKDFLQKNKLTVEITLTNNVAYLTIVNEECRVKRATYGINLSEDNLKKSFRDIKEFIDDTLKSWEVE